MRIKNEYRETVCWRVFKGDDTIYTVGLAQGRVEPDKSGDWRDDSFDDIKVEIKTGDIVFSKDVLARAGRRFKMVDDLVVSKAGTLDVAQVQFLADRGPQQIKRSDVQFIDTRNFDGPVERTLTSRVSTAFTNTEISESSSSHEQTWTVGGKFGGGIGKKDIGSVNADVSLQFQDKVVNALRTSHQTVVNHVWDKTVVDKMTFAAGKLYVIEYAWTLTLDRGSATYFGEKTSFSVVRSAEPTRLTPAGYDSPEKLPDEYRQEWSESRSGKTKVQAG
jgi:hypothetical protein